MKDRIVREKKTVEVMVRIYCRVHHASARTLCAFCAPVLDYARLRLEQCPFQDGKTTCARCRVHCFKPEMREKIRTVMRFSGPKMVLEHPVMALLHWRDSFRESAVPARRKFARR